MQAVSPCSQPGGCYTITFTPADGRGNLAGPGKTPLIYIAPASGVMLAAVQDHLDGSYTIRVGSLGPPGVPPPIHYGNTSINTAQAGRTRRPIEIVLPYAGVTGFANALGLKNGVVVGGRVGYRISNQLTVQAEVGATFTKTSANRSGRVIQLLANGRWDTSPIRIRKWVPHLTFGVGYALFRGFGVNDKAFLYQAGLGATFQLRPGFGLRADARALHIADVFGAGGTTNYQGTVGLVWWF